MVIPVAHLQIPTPRWYSSPLLSTAPLPGDVQSHFGRVVGGWSFCCSQSPSLLDWLFRSCLCTATPLVAARNSYLSFSRISILLITVALMHFIALICPMTLHAPHGLNPFFFMIFDANSGQTRAGSIAWKSNHHTVCLIHSWHASLVLIGYMGGGSGGANAFGSSFGPLMEFDSSKDAHGSN